MMGTYGRILAMQLDVWYDLESENDYISSVTRYSRPESMHIKLPDSSGPIIDDTLKSKFENLVANKWQEIGNVLEKLFGEDVPQKVIVRLSSYGMGGSYHLPGDWRKPDYGVTIKKCRLFDACGALKTEVLVHELIHLCIEQQLRKKGWSRNYDPRREWLVDEIMQSNECQTLSPGRQHQGGNKRPDAGLDEIIFKNRPTF